MITAVVIFFASIFILLFYYFYFFNAFIRHHSMDRLSDQPLSVIISAHNEAENLRKNLPLFLKQKHPALEIIVINDQSYDETEDVLREFEEKFPGKIKITHVAFSKWKTFKGNKKYALTLGIKGAQNDRLLLTDADCVPVSPHWAQRMNAGFDLGKKIVLGYGKYKKEKSFLNLLIRFETLHTSMLYFSFALKGLPYMGVGRNLAYLKSFFLENDGFKNHFQILSGDDDLFVNENATSQNTGICMHPEAHTVSEPKKTWKAWFEQKRRHYLTGGFYKTKHKILLGIYSASGLFFWVGFIYLLFSPLYAWALAGGMFKMIIFSWMVYQSGKKLQDYIPVWSVIFLEPVLLLFQMIVYLSVQIKKPVKWM